MNRTLLSVLALVVLLGLTGGMWALADGQGSTSAAGGLAAVAALKIVVIGAVFLELDHAWPGWAVLGAAIVGVVLGGAVLLMG
ncbi:MAG: hypothetical protein Q8P18_01550 [Pseudomonadota bacterium]|nr:hypothetical protein [Pseudomonadota bacterium]